MPKKKEGMPIARPEATDVVTPVKASTKPATQQAPAKPQPQPDNPVNESYEVIKRGDSYVVEVTLYGRKFHDERVYPHKHDAERRLEELSKDLK